MWFHRFGPTSTISSAFVGESVGRRGDTLYEFDARAAPAGSAGDVPEASVAGVIRACEGIPAPPPPPWRGSRLEGTHLVDGP